MWHFGKSLFQFLLKFRKFGSNKVEELRLKLDDLKIYFLSAEDYEDNK